MTDDNRNNISDAYEKYQRDISDEKPEVYKAAIKEKLTEAYNTVMDSNICVLGWKMLRWYMPAVSTLKAGN